jgi:hypothetical protein
MESTVRRQAGDGIVVPERVRALVVAEEPLGQTDAAFHREPEPLDLDQVGPDPDDVHRLVLVLASLRREIAGTATPKSSVIACATARRARTRAR